MPKFNAYLIEDKQPVEQYGNNYLQIEIIKKTKCYVTIKLFDMEYKVMIREDSIGRPFIIMKENKKIGVYLE